MSTFERNPEIIDVEDRCNDNTSINNSDREIICLDENNSDNKDEQNHSDDNQDTVVFNSILDKHNSKVTYGDVLELATDLCRTVSDDPKLCRSTYATLFERVTKLRQGDKFDVAFNNKGLPKSGDTSNKMKPIPAVITPPLRGRKRRQRFKSCEEIKRTFGRKYRFEDNNEEYDS